jgi:hypothetical protein
MLDRLEDIVQLHQIIAYFALDDPASQPRLIQIEIGCTACYLGGARARWRCPWCGRRVALLYVANVIALRRGLRLVYASQSEDAMTRTWRKQLTIERRLSCGDERWNGWGSAKGCARRRATGSARRWRTDGPDAGGVAKRRPDNPDRYPRAGQMRMRPAVRGEQRARVHMTLADLFHAWQVGFMLAFQRLHLTLQFTQLSLCLLFFRA